MTKEVDFLSLGKSENSTKTNTNTSKKEGLSLFDSLLVNSKKNEIDTNSEGSLEKSTENKQNENLTKQTLSQNEQNLKQEENSSKVKNNTSNESEQKNQVLEEKNIDTKEVKQSKEILNQKENTSSSVKTQSDTSTKSEVKQQSSMSLLDRMVLEAKKSIKSPSSETIVEDTKSSGIKQGVLNSENKIDTEIEYTKVKDNSLKTEQKIESQTNKNSKLENSIEIKNEVGTITKENTKISNNDGKIEENPKNINEIKNSSSEENVENTNKSNSSLNETSKIETESLQKDLASSQNVKEEITNELESSVNKNTDNGAVSKEQEKSIELKKVDVQNIETKDTNRGNTAKNIEQNVDIKNVENDIKASPVNEQRVNLENSETPNLEKETKVTVNSKEAVQTTMNFDDLANVEENIKNIDNQQKEVKQETKSDNSTVNSETKNSPVNDVFVRKDTEIKKTDLVQENVKESKSSTVTLDEVETVKIEDNKIKNSTNSIESEKSVKTVDENNSKALKSNLAEENIVPKTDSTKNTTKETNQDFSKLDSKAFVQEEQRVNVNKEILKETHEVKPQTETKEEIKSGKSLMDRLLDNAKEQTVTVKNANLNNETLETQITTTQKSNDIATNMFLSSQKNSIYTQMVVNKSEGVKTVKNASSIEDVKDGAKILDLGLEDASVEVQKVTKESNVIQKVTKALDSQISLLDKIAFEKNMSLDELNSKLQSQIATMSSTTSTSSTTTEESVVNMNVNTTLALNIQNRIIGAQQQMASMMSDVARNMYENYKPPVTAFRLNLFPAQLGHIAILMKNDRENSISISMNMSQSSTLDAFVENQTVLRDALNRTFENQQTSFSLDFNMEEGSNDSANEKQEDNQDKQTNSSDEIMESIIQNQDTSEDSNYM